MVEQPAFSSKSFPLRLVKFDETVIDASRGKVLAAKRKPFAMMQAVRRSYRIAACIVSSPRRVLEILAARQNAGGCTKISYQQRPADFSVLLLGGASQCDVVVQGRD